MKKRPLLPGEFEPHRATYLLWPTRPDNWRDNALPAQQRMLQLANLLSRYEPVYLGHNFPIRDEFLSELSSEVRLFNCDYDDIWIRDTGPTFIFDSDHELSAVDWLFNSWGGLFDSAARDNALAEGIAKRENVPSRKLAVVLEGGAIVTDGRGTIITTEEAILAANRNPTLAKSDIEDIFLRELGCPNVIWLPTGLSNDEAGGHVDNVCAFADSGKIIISHTQDVTHPSYHSLREAENIIRRSKNAANEPFEIIRIPLPPMTVISASEADGFAPSHGTIRRSKGSPLAPSHVNFYLANDVVVAPIFDLPSDEGAIEILKAVFSNQRTVVPFPSREFLLGGGAVHCLTREVPA